MDETTEIPADEAAEAPAETEAAESDLSIKTPEEFAAAMAARSAAKAGAKAYASAKASESKQAEENTTQGKTAGSDKEASGKASSNKAAEEEEAAAKEAGKKASEEEAKAAGRKAAEEAAAKAAKQKAEEAAMKAARSGGSKVEAVSGWFRSASNAGWEAAETIGKFPGVRLFALTRFARYAAFEVVATYLSKGIAMEAHEFHMRHPQADWLGKVEHLANWVERGTGVINRTALAGAKLAGNEVKALYDDIPVEPAAAEVKSAVAHGEQAVAAKVKAAENKTAAAHEQPQAVPAEQAPPPYHITAEEREAYKTQAQVDVANDVKAEFSETPAITSPSLGTPEALPSALPGRRSDNGGYGRLKMADVPLTTLQKSHGLSEQPFNPAGGYDDKTGITWAALGTSVKDQKPAEDRVETVRLSDVRNSFAPT